MQPNVEDDYIEWKGWSRSAFSKFSNEERIQFAAEVRRVGTTLDREARVLEIGFGNGSFAGWIRQFTHHYVGIDPTQHSLTGPTQLVSRHTHPLPNLMRLPETEPST